MTQADRVHSTPPTNTSANDPNCKDRALAYLRMEMDVLNLERMSFIAEEKIAEWCDDPNDARALELANFASQQLRDLIKAFRRNYEQLAWLNEGHQS